MLQMILFTCLTIAVVYRLLDIYAAPFPDVSRYLSGMNCFRVEWARQIAFLRTPGTILLRKAKYLSFPSSLSEFTRLWQIQQNYHLLLAKLHSTGLLLSCYCSVLCWQRKCVEGWCCCLRSYVLWDLVGDQVVFGLSALSCWLNFTLRDSGYSGSYGTILW